MDDTNKDVIEQAVIKEEKIVQPRKEDLDKVYVLKQAKGKATLGIPKMVDIDDVQWTKIEDKLQYVVTQVIDDRQGSISKIQKWEESIQGIPESGRTPPWDGACSVRDPMTATHCRTIETSIHQTLGIEYPFIGTVRGDKLKESRLTGLLNESARKDFGYDDVLIKATKAAVRSCVGVFVPEWERSVRISRDTTVYESLEEYKTDYPNAETAGMDVGQYKAQLKVVEDDIENEGFHECLYEYDEAIINKPTVRVVKIADLLMHPWTSPTIELAQLLAYRLKKNFNDLKMMERSGIIKNVDKVSLLAVSDKSEDDEAKKTKLESKGINADQRTLEYKDRIFDLYKGIYRLDLNNEGLEKDYEVMFIYDNDMRKILLLRVAPYAIHYGERNFIPCAILPEEGTIFGTCIPELLENPQALQDTLTRLLVDSNSIANVPMFKAYVGDKSSIGDTRQKGAVFPGRIFYSKQPQHMEAFRADRINANDYLAILRYTALQAEAQTGASRTLAGQNMADDPEAPGVKTAMMIQQSNFMINEYIKNMRPALSKLAIFILKLYRQYMKYDEVKGIKIFDESNQEKEISITRDDISFIEDDVHFDVKNQSVEDNIQMRQQLSLQDLQMLIAVPQIGENPLAVRVLVMNYLMANPRYTQKEIEQIVPTMDQIQEMFRSVAQDVLKAERAQQENQQLEGQTDQIAEQQENDIDQQIQQ